MNCDSSEICLNNECINACYKKSCKLNEACQITNHDSSCVCLPNFVRDPINKNCVPSKYTHLKINNSFEQFQYFNNYL